VTPPVPLRKFAVGALKEAVGFAIRWSGLPLMRNTYARNRVSILVYHDPQPSVLDKHLTYLAKHYRFISLDRLVAAIRLDDWATIPPKSLVVTLDDGYRGNFELLAVFAKHSLVPTIYLSTQIVATRRHYWWTFEADSQHLKRVPNSARIRILSEKYGFKQTTEYEQHDRQSLSAEEITLMRDAVDFGAHSRFHPILPMCAADECRQEIVVSKEEVETLARKPCHHFSYPNGSYGHREVEMVREAGYASARTTDVGWNSSNTDVFRLKAIEVSDDASINRLAANLTVWLASCAALLRRTRGKSRQRRGVVLPGGTGSRLESSLGRVRPSSSLDRRGSTGRRAGE
jgi:peptidoglycan/xylan/chitin deacetylase (PgdA/CDA1 family)